MTNTTMAMGASVRVGVSREVTETCAQPQRETVREQRTSINITAKLDVYEQTARVPQESAGTTYTSNAELVDQLKGQMAQTKERFTAMVKEMLEKQGLKIAEGEGVWKTLAQGEFNVDEQTQAEAQQAISPEGYWGVERTSVRIVDFAKALVGGDPARVEEMRDAFIKGYEAATEIWGMALPDITKQTYDASMKLFDEWAGVNSEEEISEVEQTTNEE